MFSARRYLFSGIDVILEMLNYFKQMQLVNIFRGQIMKCKWDVSVGNMIKLAPNLKV